MLKLFTLLKSKLKSIKDRVTINDNNNDISPDKSIIVNEVIYNTRRKKIYHARGSRDTRVTREILEIISKEDEDLIEIFKLFEDSIDRFINDLKMLRTIHEKEYTEITEAIQDDLGLLIHFITDGLANMNIVIEIEGVEYDLDKEELFKYLVMRTEQEYILIDEISYYKGGYLLSCTFSSGNENDIWEDDIDLLELTVHVTDITYN